MIASGLQGFIQQSAPYNQKFIEQTKHACCHNFQTIHGSNPHQFATWQHQIGDKSCTLNNVDLHHLSPDEEIQHCLPAFFESEDVQNLSQQLKCTLSKATQSEIETQGVITQPKPGVLTGHLVLDNKDCIYFGMELISNTNCERNLYWNDFKSMNETAQSNISTLLAQFYGAEDYIFGTNHDHTEQFFKNHQSPEVLLSLAQNNGTSSTSVKHILDKLVRMNTGMIAFNTNSRDKDIRYVSYISSKPITGFAFDHINRSTTDYEQSLLELDTYFKNASHIVLAIGCGFRDECVDGRGIFKTTSAVLNGMSAVKTVRDRSFVMSMMLHFFIKKAAHDHLKANYYFISPFGKMIDIYKTAMSSEIKHNVTILGLKNMKELNLQDQIRRNRGTESPVLTDLKKFENPLWM